MTDREDVYLQLGLDGIEVTGTQTRDDTLFADIIMERKEQICPHCGTKSSYVHDYREQKVKAAPIDGVPVILNLRKRRYVCPNCKKRFIENIPWLTRYKRTITD